MIPQRVIDRIHAAVEIDANGCWMWQRKANVNGYGRIGWHEDGVPHGALTHRAMYEAMVGPIPDGLQIDHRCHDPETCPAVGADCPHRRCCNPQHLHPATCRENVLRGGGLAPVNAAKDQCPAGHPYDDENTYVDRNGWRQCSTCRARRNAAA